MPLVTERKGLWSRAGLPSDSALPPPGRLTQGRSRPRELSFLTCEMGDSLWRAGPAALNQMKQVQVWRGASRLKPRQLPHSPGEQPGLPPLPLRLAVRGVVSSQHRAPPSSESTLVQKRAELPLVRGEDYTVCPERSLSRPRQMLRPCWRTRVIPQHGSEAAGALSLPAALASDSTRCPHLHWDPHLHGSLHMACSPSPRAFAHLAPLPCTAFLGPSSWLTPLLLGSAGQHLLQEAFLHSLNSHPPGSQLLL